MRARCTHCRAKCSRHPDVFRGNVFCPDCYWRMVDIASLIDKIIDQGRKHG